MPGVKWEFDSLKLKNHEALKIAAFRSEILEAAMMLLFVAVGGILQTDLTGFFSMLIAHITFSLPYVILSISPRFKQFDRSLREAVVGDLGDTAG